MMLLAHVPQALGNQVGVVNHDLTEFIDFGHGQLPGWGTDADTCKNQSRLVADRGSNAAQTRLVLAIVNCVAALTREIKFGSEGVNLGESRFGKTLKPGVDNTSDNLFGLIREDGLAHAGAVDWRIFDHRVAEHCLGFSPLDDDGAMAVENGEMHGAARQAMEGVDDGPAFAIELEIGEHCIAQLEKSQTETVGVAFALLLDKAHLTHGGKQSMRGRARIARLNAYFGQRQRTMRGVETVEHARHLGQRFQAFVAASRFGWPQRLIGIGHVLVLNAHIEQSRTTVNACPISSLAANSQATDTPPC